MNHDHPNNNQLPSYITGAVPNPLSNRAPWTKNTAPTYAGIFLWFVFWLGATQAPNAGGVLSHGVWAAVLSLALAALICYLFYYVVMGILGMKTGLPLYIVGTSTFGAKGGFIMPGFLMGILQFGWLGVNINFSSTALAAAFPSISPSIIMIIWGVLAAFMGLKGIQYVAKIATYLPLIPLVALIVMFAKTAGGLATFKPDEFIALHKSMVPDAPEALGALALVAFIITYVVGFFATAGAAGTDFGTNSRDERDVHLGGFVGVTIAIIFTAGMAMLILAGAYGTAEYASQIKSSGKFVDNAFGLLNLVMGNEAGKWIGILLALSAFPSACFSSLIAANSFKTTLSKVNPFVSVGIGTAVSILLAVSGKAAGLIPIFNVIGASFGPICGAMAVDYIMAGCKWAGPRAGFNAAGWLAWGFGFIVGIMPNLGLPLMAAPFWAMVVGAVVYFICAKAGLESPVVPLRK